MMPAFSAYLVMRRGRELLYCHDFHGVGPEPYGKERLS